MSDNSWKTVIRPGGRPTRRQAELTRKSGLDGQAQLTSIRQEHTELGPGAARRCKVGHLYARPRRQGSIEP